MVYDIATYETLSVPAEDAVEDRDPAISGRYVAWVRGSTADSEIYVLRPRDRLRNPGDR